MDLVKTQNTILTYLNENHLQYFIGGCLVSKVKTENGKYSFTMLNFFQSEKPFLPSFISLLIQFRVMLQGAECLRRVLSKHHPQVPLLIVGHALPDPQLDILCPFTTNKQTLKHTE